MFEECICIKDYEIFRKGKKYKYECGRYTLIFYIGDTKFIIDESKFYNYFRDLH